MNDRDLLQATASGNPTAFNLLSERYRKAVYHTAYHILENWADAEDVMQEVFMRILCSGAQFRGESSGLLLMSL